MSKMKSKNEDEAEYYSKLTKSKLLSITFNNFACIYKRMKEPESALDYLNIALQAEED
jgi:hypothetical protein